ncbi:MAG: Nif3-like dinuclear metal center hexameric protein [Coriobacteriales bacterium]|nr:Nif3-like dinuclear metal center hexameric protein [Coriobacteriales bacterium]
MSAMTLRELEQGLFEAFPERLADDFDNVGLLLGNADATVERVAIALDPSLKALEQAIELGCNVLLTHHPLFLSTKAPTCFVTGDAALRDGHDDISCQQAAHTLIAAAKADVALIAMHTNLDFAPVTQSHIPQLLGMDYVEPLVHMGGSGAGFGQLCEVQGISAGELAAHCHEVLGAPPRLWGDPNRVLSRVAYGQGAAGDLIVPALRADCDCVVCGELRYHTATAALQAGLTLIELGHDVSERPLIQVLERAALDLGLERGQVVCLDLEPDWETILMVQDVQEVELDVRDG